jgi:hypothetical protein
VGVERLHELDDAVVLVRLDQVERRTVEPPARRIDVDPGELAHPRLALEQGRDARTEVASHPAHQNAPSGHPPPPYRPVAVANGLGAASVSAASAR